MFGWLFQKREANSARDWVPGFQFEVLEKSEHYVVIVNPLFNGQTFRQDAKTTLAMVEDLRAQGYDIAFTSPGGHFLTCSQRV